jgi:hypothetical protein
MLIQNPDKLTSGWTNFGLSGVDGRRRYVLF